MTAMSKYWTSVVVIYAVAILIAAWCVGYEVELSTDSSINVGFLLGLLIIAHATASFKIVGPHDLARIDFFGRPIAQIGSGPTFVPFLIFSLKRETKNAIQLELFAPIVEGQEKKRVDTPDVSIIPGQRGELNVTTANAETARYDDPSFPSAQEERRAHSNDLLHKRRMTMRPQVTVRWEIEDFIQMTSKIGGVHKVNSQIEEAVATVLQTELSRLTAAQIKQRTAYLSAYLLRKVEELVGEKPVTDVAGVVQRDANGNEVYNERWGINVLSVRLTETPIEKTVQDSVNAAAKAQGDADKTVAEAKATAEGEKAKGFAAAAVKQREAEVAAKARQLLGLAEAASLKALAKEMKKPEAMVAAQLRAMQEALSHGNNHLLMAGGKFDDILAALAGFAAKAKKKP